MRKERIKSEQEEDMENIGIAAKIMESPEIITQEATKEVADFKREGQERLGKEVERAQTDGITIDPKDINELKEIEDQAEDARKKLANALGIIEKVVDLSDQDKKRTIVEKEANYPGDQTLLLKDRLLHPSTQEKLNRIYEKHKNSFQEGEPDKFSKDRDYRFYQERHVKELQERVNRLFQSTEFGKADDYATTSIAKGIKVSKGQSYEDHFRHPGAVFTDAETKEGKPLSERQKNIIEAHEKGHAVREFSGGMAREIKSVIDFDLIPKDKTAYFGKSGDEIIERMSQLKNYFGFKGDEQFTKEHLDHARENYIKDTGIDNDMKIFFNAITPEKEEQFLQVMNSYPI